MSMSTLRRSVDLHRINTVAAMYASVPDEIGSEREVLEQRIRASPSRLLPAEREMLEYTFRPSEDRVRDPETRARLNAEYATPGFPLLRHRLQAVRTFVRHAERPEGRAVVDCQAPRRYSLIHDGIGLADHEVLLTPQRA